jgi:hypothetical protein
MMIDFLTSIRRFQKAILAPAARKANETFRQNSENAENSPRGRARVRREKYTSDNFWAGPASSELAAFCCDLEALRAAMLAPATCAISPNSGFECTDVPHDLEKSLEDNVAQAVHMLSARMIGK